MAHLARSRHGQSIVEPDHWALLATAKLLLLYERLQDALISRDAHVGHVVQICHSILRKQPTELFSPRLFGSFSPIGVTCQTATRLEGTLAALTILSKEHAGLAARIVVSAEHGIAFLIRAQVQDGEYAGAIPCAIDRLPAEYPGNVETINTLATEVRIDYVQHAMCAMIQYAKILSKTAALQPVETVV